MTRSVADLSAAWDQVASVKAAWHAGETPDAAGVIAAHPSLALQRSIVVDLAYEEFRIRETAGESPDPESFAAQFPGFEASVLDMLGAHRLLCEQPELLDLPPAEWPPVGAKYDGLELRSELGSGAFGRAYLAFDPVLGRLRALKITRGGLDEARVIGGLPHPHIIDVLWARSGNGLSAVCMPFVGATTLADVIAKSIGRRFSAQAILELAEEGRLDLPPGPPGKSLLRPTDSYLVGACAIGARIAEAVDFLHGKQVVHGDLKPSNVVLEPDGSPRLIDFNLASDESRTAIRGTPAYMAPELLDATMPGGSTAGIDAQKADIFALGVMLVELLTGRHPFRATGGDILLALSTAIHKGPPNLAAVLPHAIADVLTSCQAVNPARRPAAVSVMAVLDRFVQRERSRGRRHRNLALAGAAAALAAALVLPGTLDRTAQPAGAAEPTFPIETPRPPLTTFERGLQALRAGDLDEARSCFLKADRQDHDPWGLVWASYLYAQSGDQLVAIRMAQEAMSRGIQSAEIENNIAYSLIQTRKSSEALDHLGKSVALSGGKLQAAFFNRAYVHQARAISSTKGINPADEQRAALEDIREAIRLGSGPAEFHYRAATIFAMAGAPELKAALDHLNAAVDVGRNPQAFPKDPLLANLKGNPDFEALCRRVPSQPESKVQFRLVEPKRP